MIDLEAARLLILRDLPPRVRWLINWTPCDYDFSRSQALLRPIEAADLGDCEIVEEWTSLALFGEEDFAKGGGARPFIGIHRETREVFGLDIERESFELFLLNSSLE